MKKQTTNIKALIRFLLSALIMSGSTVSMVNAELNYDSDRAHCSGYADAMSNVYHNRYYNLMAEYFGPQFEQDGNASNDLKKLQSLYDDAYNKVNTTARISDNLDNVCEDDFVNHVKSTVKK